nr:CHAT domain-containing protein [Thermoflexibacter sp.]
MKPIIFLAFANDKVDNARYLRNLPLELDGIRKALQPAVKEGLCELIERANVSIEQIFDVFQTYQDRIAIFHYGGHADGYQLLLETLTVATSSVSGSNVGDNKVAYGEGLVSFFARQRGLQLVFFNGCSTQQQSIELVKAGIPAVIGTSNSINDDIATTLSIRFYTGLAKGASIDKAWAEATDEVKMKEGTANLRGLYRKTQTEVVADRFPWEIYYREGAEKVKEWNLPEEVDNPLFGLPNIPPTFALPESPFLFLKRYERPHAELFFGRSFYVRELYNKITDTQSPPVILLYGQSGTGKSSLFDAGINPRLENSHHVIYLRRNQALGLVRTLEEGIVDMKLSVGTLTTAEKVSPEGGDLEGANKRLQILQNLKNQLLSLAESEKINLSATIEALEKELLMSSLSFGNEGVRQKSSVGTLTTGISPLSEGEGQGATIATVRHIFNEQKFLTQVGESPYLPLLRAWHTLENQLQKPVLVILDQAEELFTRPNKQINNELEELAQCLKAMFNHPAFAPQGKLILGYRKEYQAEFEERFKECAIPRTKVFLEPLSRKDILDIFKGLTETPNLKKRYNLQIDKNLPIVVADDLLEDKDSPVAPVLQILLTKMWDK